jgi:hypothetical protein
MTNVETKTRRTGRFVILHSSFGFDSGIQISSFGFSSARDDDLGERIQIPCAFAGTNLSAPRL